MAEFTDADRAAENALQNAPKKPGAQSAKSGVQSEILCDAEAIWQQVRTSLRSEVGDATFNSWLKPLEFVTLEGGRVVLGIPTRFMRDWITNNYKERFLNLWQEHDTGVRRIDLIVRSRLGRRTAPEGLGQDGKPLAKVAAVSGAEISQGDRSKAARLPAMPARTASTDGGVFGDGRSPGNLHLDSNGETIGAPLDGRFVFDNFIVGKSNELAHAAARRVAESDGVSFNPLFLYGGVGLGKSHLMHAIAWEINKRTPERKVLYLSAEKFMYQFIRALRYKDTMAFKQQFRSVDVLMIDDVQFISGKETTQEEFFHTFNALIDHNRQVIISADRSPSDLEGIEERIRSRLGWGLSADIHPTDYELRLGILHSKAEISEQRYTGIDIPPRVLEFLAHRITSNVRELEGALNRVVAFSTLVGRPITLEMTQEVLQDLLRANEKRITIDDIQRRVAEYFNIRLADMLSARRSRAVARPRQVAMYLSKQLTSRSLPEIGRRFGGRDHTTVMHACRKIEELRSQDPTLDDDVDMLRRMLEG